MRKLKDKVWLEGIIKIERLVEQTKEGAMTENKTLGYLIDIKKLGGGKTMFREDDPKKVWERIAQELYLTNSNLPITQG